VNGVAMVQEQLVWKDGTMMPRARAALDPFAYGLHYATSFFEGIRSFVQRDGSVRIFRLEDHLARFFESADRLRIRIPYRRTDIAAACAELLARNVLSEAYVRPIAFLDSPFDVWPKPKDVANVMVIAVPYPAKHDPEQIPTRKAIVAGYRRSRASAELYRAKATGHYAVTSVEANNAQRAGVNQAIFLDETNRVCEGLSDNIFVVRGSKVATPSDDAPILLGITRRTVIELLRARGVDVSETDLPLDALKTADEIFTTGTASGIQAIVEVEHDQVGTGGVGPVARLVYSAYAACVRSENSP
jgi:branched-chain amino acid aminotransferase